MEATNTTTVVTRDTKRLSKTLGGKVQLLLWIKSHLVLGTQKLPTSNPPFPQEHAQQGLLCVLLGERRVGGRQFLSSQDQVTFYPQ